jgi:hypothetical protein
MSSYYDVATLRREQFHLVGWFAYSREHIARLGDGVVSDESIVEERPLQSPFSRRSLLKAGAVVGGTVWMAPVIDSFVSRAAAASAPPACPPAGAYGLSGLTILYTRGGGTLYWTFIGEGETTCDPGGGSISNDDSFTTSECGGNVLDVNTPEKGVTWNGNSPTIDTNGCCFAATAGGANLINSSTCADVTVLAWIAHNGTFTGGTPLGGKGHFEVQCGTSSPSCPSSPFEGGG